MAYQPSWVISIPKPALLKNSKGFFVTKVNVTARLKFELVNYDVAVQYVSHYATGTLRSASKDNIVIIEGIV